MKFPKLKNPLISRIAIYVAVLLPPLAIMAVICSLRFIHEIIKVVTILAALIYILVIVFKNFAILIAMDAYLGALECRLSARKQFNLPNDFSQKLLMDKIEKFGQKCEPKHNQPQPTSLRYKFSASQTVDSSGIEKVIAAYNADRLDKDTYNFIMNSALANSKALIGKKKPRFLDSEQKKAPLNRVTIVLIFVSEVEENFKKDIYKTVCKKEGDGFDVSVLPCIIDLKDRTCVFNSERIVYMGFQYPVKNRGIKIIRKLVFGGKLPLTDEHKLELDKETDLEQTVWDFWKQTIKDDKLDEKKTNKRFEKMAHREIIFEDELLYIKLNDKGVCLLTDLDEQGRTYTVFGTDSWEFPKSSKISKENIKEIKSLATTYFAVQGYTTEFLVE